MTLALVLVGVALLAFPAVAHRASVARPPGEWSRVVASTLFAGMVVTELGLLLTALPTVLHLPVIADATGACHAVVDRLNVGPLFGWLSLVLAVSTLVVALMTTQRARRLAARARVEPWLGTHHLRGAYEVVLVPTAQVLAMSVPGRLPQVVVSDGVADTLGADRLEAVIEHEAAHLRLRHRRYLLVAAIVDRAFGWFPGARRSAHALRDAVEEWADAAAVGPSRTNQEHLRGALTALARTGTGPTLGEVDRRVLRLDRIWPQTPIAGRLLGYSPAATLAAAGATLLATWFGASHHLVSFSGYCPH